MECHLQFELNHSISAFVPVYNKSPKEGKQLNREVYLTKFTASINALPGRCYCPINFSCTAQYHHVWFFKEQYTHYVPNQFYNLFGKLKGIENCFKFERENGVMSISFLKSGVAMFWLFFPFPFFASKHFKAPAASFPWVVKTKKT